MAAQQYAYVVAGSLLRFDEYLSANAAGCNRLVGKGIVGAARRNGYGHHRSVGILRLGIVQAATFGTGACPKGGILLVAALHRLALLQEHSSAHLEAGLGGVTQIGGLARRVCQSALGWRQIIIRTVAIGNSERVFHNIICKCMGGQNGLAACSEAHFYQRDATNLHISPVDCAMDTASKRPIQAIFTFYYHLCRPP